MREASAHAAQVDAWVRELPQGLAPEQLVSVFEQSFFALWRRAELTLGEVTVAAIAERVLHDASVEFPLLAALKADDGVQFGELRGLVKREDATQLREGMRSTLTQFLTVMGNLTANILTPALYSELSLVGVTDLSPNGDRPPGGPTGQAKG
jgi:hypothetical protein